MEEVQHGLDHRTAPQEMGEPEHGNEGIKSFPPLSFPPSLSLPPLLVHHFAEELVCQLFDPSSDVVELEHQQLSQ